MSLHNFMFYLFSAVILIFSVLTITSRRVLRSATYLLFVLLATAGYYYILNYQFLAAVQIALYAGGIVVLIIFSILLTSHVSERSNLPSKKNIITAIITVVGGLIIIAPVLFSFPFTPNNKPEMPATVQNIGRELVAVSQNGYSLVFEVISVLLLAALVGSIIIAKKPSEKHDTK